jgi:alpha-glucosidase
LTSQKDKFWWKKAIGYQIYPISFFDSNDDGIGDIRGIIQKIDYIKYLGVDLIWLNPVYRSPKIDNGYDISNFQEIDPDFGTLEDLKELIELLHQNGIHLIMDLVINHTSDQHPWFIQALQSKDNKYHDYYHWVDGDANHLPNDWENWSGDFEWTFVPHLKQWYFHIFNSKMPDLNWENPKLRDEIISMIKWWLEFGIDGFRLDAISHIKKMPFDNLMADVPSDKDKWSVHTNVNGFKDFLELIKNVFSQYPIFTVGEASGVSSSLAQIWTGEQGYFNSIFELEHNIHDETDLNGRPIGNRFQFKNIIDRWQTDTRSFGWMSPYLSNHDNPRALQTWGDNKSSKSAKALATILLSLQGTPFVYFGDEIGIPSFNFQSIEEINDPEAHIKYDSLITKGENPQDALSEIGVWNRDQGRSPMQWNSDKNAGFTKGTPYFKVNPSYKKVNVEQQIKQNDSTLNYYKKLIALRKKNSALNDGEYYGIESNDQNIFAFIRKAKDKTTLTLVNLSENQNKFVLPEKILNFNWHPLINNFIGNLKIEKKISLNPWNAIILESDDYE